MRRRQLHKAARITVGFHLRELRPVHSARNALPGFSRFVVVEAAPPIVAVKAQLFSCVCFGVQAEFMRTKLDVLRPESSPYQQRPEIALVIVHLVVIHFVSR